MSRKNKFFIGVSPLGLLALSACGGGGGGGGGAGGGGATFTAQSGKAQKGPLNNATVFLDYDKDGVFDVGETKTTTDADGAWSLTPTNGTYNIVVTTTLDQFGNSATTDSTVGGVVDAITLIAPSGADNAFNGANIMVTPATTMISNLMALDATLSAADAKANVAKALGFVDASGNATIDPLLFDAFDTTGNQVGILDSTATYADLALQAEKTSQKIMTVVNTFAAAIEGTGASEADALTAAFGSVTSVLSDKIANLSDATKSAAEKVLDFDVASDISAVTTKLAADIASVTGSSKVAFDSLTSTVEASIANVVKAIDDISDINETQSAFQTIALVSEQVKAAAVNAEKNFSDASLYAGQDPDGISVAAAVENNAKLVIDGALAASGSVTNATAQQITITSAGDDSGISFYIIGKDASGADLVETLAGVKAGMATSAGSFSVVASITAIGDPAGTVAAGVLGVLSEVATDADGISTAAAVANDAALALNGVLVDSTTNDVTNVAAVKVTITSAGDDSAVKFVVVGTNAAGAAQTETVTGANAATATSTGSFKTITSITADGDPAGTVSAGVAGNSAAVTVALSDADTFATVKNSAAPTDIFGTSSYAESDSSLVAGTLGTVDAGQATGHKYTLLTGLDYDSFTLTEAGVLSFKAQPDFETKSAYSVKVMTKNDADKSYIETLQIAVTDANEQPVITAAGDIVSEDSGYYSITGTVSAVDPEGQAVTYGASSLNGAYGGSLVIDAATGAYTYTMNNDNGSVQDLQKGDTLTETFTVLASDGVTQGSGSLSFTINGADDVYLTPPMSTDADGISVSAAVANNAALTIGGALAASGSVTNSVAQKVTIASAGDDSGISFTVVGTDASGTALTETVTGANAGTATSSGAFKTISSITAVGDPAGNVSAGVLGHVLTEGDTATISGTLSGSDPAGGTLNYSIAGSIVADGSYAATGTYGSLTVNATTGAYVYTLDNTDADTNGIAKDAVLTETFKVRVDDGTDRSSKDLKIEITGINDNPVLTAPTNGSVTEGGTSTASGSLTVADADTGEAAGATFAITGGAVTSGSSVLEGTYGSLSLNVTSGAYTYTLNQSDADTVALTAADSKTETFTVAATDANGGVGSTTLSIAVVGTGITVDPIATDDKVNAAEDAAGFNITGRGTVGQTVTLSFASSTTLAGGNTATVDSNGDWSVAVVAADIDSMAEGGETVTATIGSDNSGAKSFAIDTVVPASAITAVKYDSVVDADGISVAAAVANNAALVLGGVLASGGAVTNSAAQKVTISSVGNDSGIKFTVVGTDATGAALTEDVTGANAGTATSTGSFKTITSITAVGNPAGNVSVGTDAKQLVLTGTKFDEIGATGADVKSQIDWTKLVWDINGDAADAGVTFAVGDIASAVVTSATVLTIQLTGTKAAALEGTTGFAAAGAADNVDIAVGFSVDGAGNVATTDAAANVNPSYSDNVRPSVTKFSSTTADGSFKLGDTINITATLSEVVLSGSGITVTLNDTGSTQVALTNTSNSNTLTGTYTVPANATATDLSVQSYALTSGKTVTDPFGNAMNSTALPSGENLGDNQAFAIDTSVPTNTISSVQYNSTDKSLVFTGTDMTTIAAAGVEIKTALDWTKLNWDIDGDDAATAGKTFVVSEISSAKVTSATVLTITLTADAATALEGTVGFAADGLGSTDTNDTIDVAAGFSRDLAGNAANTDAAANLSPTYSDGTKPTVASFTSTTANGSFKEGDAINITANMSEVVLGGSSITVTLSTSDTVALTAAANGTTLVGTYTVPASKTATDLTISSYVIGSGGVKDLYGNTMSSTALPSSIAADPDGISVAAAVGNNAALTIGGALASSGAVTNAVAQKVTILSAGNDSAISFTVAGTNADGASVTETVAGANAGTATSTGLFKTVTSITAVGNPAGNVSAGTAVNAQNLADNKDLVIDTTVPTSTITGISYGVNATSGAGEIIFTGTKFNTLASTDTDVKSSLNWSKLVWDLDADASNAGVTFAASDFASAVVSSATTLTATLTSTKKASLEATNGFAQDGLGSTPAADNIDVSAGFIVDLAGNAATTDAAANTVPTYTDGTAPTVTKFTSTTPDGGYKTDDVINITATMSEAVIAGGQITVTLDTGETVDLTAATNGTTLTGDYTVGSGKTSSDLAVSSFAVKTAVTDLYNNALTDVTVPGSQNLSDNSAIVIDTAGPTNTITGVAFDSSAKTITLAGTKFDTIAAVNQDVKASLDWSKFVWDLDGSATNAGVTFSAGDITSAKVTSATVMTITLTNSKFSDLVATTGFAADGLGATNTADNVDITAGFSRDASGNAATTDGLASVTPTYSDTTKPTITSFTSTTTDGGYGAPKNDINITATASETVLAGSNIKATLDTGDVITLTAATNGTTLVGLYDPGTGDTSSDLTVDSYVAGSAGVIDTYGNVMSATALPTGQNLADNSAIFIDTAKPTSTITAAAYDNNGGKITLTGTNMTSLGTAGTDVKANLDWTKLTWDLDASSSDAGVGFQLSDITSATVTNATTLTIDLTATKQSSLEGTTGFGAGGLEAGTTVGDNIDVAQGFTRDAVGNASTDDAKANMSPTYADSAKPTVSNFTSTTADGSYKSGESINITATMNEAILAGSKMTVTLSTTDLVTLTAGQNGTTLSGTYTISAADTSSDLAISSYSLTDASGTTNSVIDAFGNAMSATTLPAGQNLSDNKALVVDNTALFTNATVNLSANPAAGDTFALTFNEAVSNTSAISTAIADNAAFGASSSKATTSWSADAKTATVTLGTGETFNADMTLTLASVLDLASNEATSVVYTLDIA